jgi:hypothetical protein
MFIHHRRSSFFAASELWDPALLEADLACAIGRPPFEAYALRTDILIEMHRYSDALEQLDGMERKFRTQSKDVQLGLRCKLLVRRGEWVPADAVWHQMLEKTSDMAIALRLRILELKMKDMNIGMAQRQSAEQERRLISGTSTPTFLVSQYADDDDSTPN